MEAYLKEQAEEYSEEEDEESEEMEEKAEMETLKTVDTSDFTEEQQAQFIEGWVLAGGYIDDLVSPAPWACPWYHGNTKIKVFGDSPKAWGAQWWAQCKDEITEVAQL